MLRRAVVVLLFAGLLSWIAFAVAGQWLPKSGFGLVLYWLHDAIYLPFKGYTYRLHFPNSLVWWLIGAVVLGLTFLSLLLDRSFLRAPHVWLLTRCVRLPGSSRPLLVTANALRRAGVQPELLRKAVSHESELALLEAATKPAGLADTRLCAQIGRLAVLDIQLRALPSGPLPTGDLLAAGVVWHAAFLPTDLCRRRKIEDMKMGAASERIAAEVLALRLSELIGYPAQVVEGEDASADSPFSAQRLMLDLWRLAALAVHGVVGAGPPHLFPPDFGSRPPQIQKALLMSCYERVQVLQSWAIALQPMGRKWSADSNPRGKIADGLGGHDRSVLPAVGRLTLNVALHASWIGNAPELALAMVDAIEMISLGAGLFRGDADTANDLNTLLAGLPPPHAYSLTAQLAEKNLHARQRQWEPFAEFSDNPIQPLDFQHALDQVDALYQAAGPHLWSPAAQGGSRQ